MCNFKYGLSLTKCLKYEKKGFSIIDFCGYASMVIELLRLRLAGNMVNGIEVNHLRRLVKKLTEFIAEYDIAEYEEKRTKKNCRKK